MSVEQMNAERLDFWTAFAEAAPDLGLTPSPGQEKELPLACEGRVRLVMSLSQDKTSVYLVGRSDAAKAWIVDHLHDLEQGVRMVAGKTSGEAGAGRWFRKDTTQAAVTQRRQWPEMRRWLLAQHQTFARAVAGASGKID